MKALLLSTNLDLPEAYLIRGLQEAGVKITLLISEKSPFLEVLENSAVKIIFWEFKSRLDLRSIFYIRSLFNKDSFDIVHSFNSRALSAALMASFACPVKHVAYRGTTGHLSRWDPSSWLSYFHPRLDAIICVSEAVKRYLSNQGVDSNKLIRIYKGHDPQWYHTKTLLTRADLGFDQDDFIVGCSANMRPVKGVDLLVSAFQELSVNRKIKLLLIGEIRDSVILKQLSDSRYKHAIKTLGFRKDAMQILSLCDVFCMPSRKREGLPKALIEAMIQGVAPVVTNVGGMPELVIDGKHGLVVEEENPKALARAIEKLYQQPDLKNHMAEEAKLRITQDFHISATITQTLELYRRLS